MSLPTITEQVQETTEPHITLTLPFELRQKSRLRTRLDDNQEVRIVMPHGTCLKQGMLLRADTGLIVKIVAALETVSTATTDMPLLLARACYHLGNRHVPLQIDQGWVRYLYDPVLDTMVCNLGLHIIREQAPFHAEAGAYGGSHHPKN
jgi:urease accessory protein